MKLLDLLSNLTLEYEEEKLLLDTCASLQQYQFEPWYQLVFTMMYLAVVVFVLVVKSIHACTTVRFDFVTDSSFEPAVCYGSLLDHRVV